MSFRNETERLDAHVLAETKGARLARRLGHAVVLARNGNSVNATFDAFDSWKPLKDGWKVVAFVSSTGKVVACAEETG